MPGSVARVGEELMRPVILVMTRRMLLGIKERAERHATDGSREGPASAYSVVARAHSS
jgi:hypothetical protein